MRVEQSTTLKEWKAENSARNCRPSDDCQWVTSKTSGSLQQSRTFIRSDISRNPALNGFRSPSPYTAELSETGIMQGSYTWTGLVGQGVNANGGAQLKWVGALARIAVDSGYEPPSDRDAARLKSRALSRLKNQQIDVSMALATHRQTLDMMASTAARVAKAWSQARQRNFAGAARTLGIRNSVRPGTKSVSSGWLQLQFGWMPLLSDIHGAYGELTSKKPQNGNLVVLRVSDDSASKATEKSVYSPYGATYGGAEIVKEITARRNFKQSFWWRLDLASLHAASRNGLTDPLVVAWDLVPFSFVVDWLLPVGQYLRNSSATMGFSYLGGSQTYFERRAVKWKSGKILNPSHSSYKNTKVSCKFAGSAYGFRMVRVVLPEPSAQMYLKNPLSTFTVVTSLALLTQRFQSNTAWKQLARTTTRGG